MSATSCWVFFFFNDTATTEIYTLSLHDALPIWRESASGCGVLPTGRRYPVGPERDAPAPRDRKSTRLNSSHSQISYAVFCLKKKKRQGESLIVAHITRVSVVLVSLRPTVRRRSE